MKFVIAINKIQTFSFSLFISLYLFIGFLLLFISPNFRDLGIPILLTMGILLSLYGITNRAKIHLNKNIRFIIFICCTYVIIQLLNFRSPLSILYPLCNFLLGYIIYIRKVNLSFLYINFTTISIILFYFMLNGYNPNTIFENGSRNLISVVMLYNSILIYFQEWKQNRTLSLIPALTSFILSIWAIGRSGIVCSTILLIIISCYSFQKKSIHSKILLLFSFFVIILFLYKIGIFNDLEILNLFVRFEDRGLSYDEDERSIMLEAYLSRINAFSFLIGYNYFNDPYFRTWDYNVHNSFISCHSLWGIGSLFFLIFITKEIISLAKRSLVLSALICIFLLRAFSDAVAFNGIYDFIIISILFYSYGKKQDEKNNAYL